MFVHRSTMLIFSPAIRCLAITYLTRFLHAMLRSDLLRNHSHVKHIEGDQVCPCEDGGIYSKTNHKCWPPCYHTACRCIWIEQIVPPKARRMGCHARASLRRAALATQSIESAMQKPVPWNKTFHTVPKLLPHFMVLFTFTLLISFFLALPFPSVLNFFSNVMYVF